MLAFPIISTMKRMIGVAFTVVLLSVLAGNLFYTALQIQRQSTVDEEHAADCIIVLGAADIAAASTVLEARLDHALCAVPERNVAHIITTGGAGGDPVFTEGSVGRNYLTARGVPPEAISVENKGETTNVRHRSGQGDHGSPGLQVGHRGE